MIVWKMLLRTLQVWYFYKRILGLNSASGVATLSQYDINSAEFDALINELVSRSNGM